MTVKRRVRIRVRVVLAVLAALALLGGAWLWLRDSALVSVEKVSITGSDLVDTSCSTVPSPAAAIVRPPACSTATGNCSTTWIRSPWGISVLT